MKVIGVKEKKLRKYFEHYYELKLDNGEFILFEKSMNCEYAESNEHLEKIYDESYVFSVLKESIVDKFEILEEKELWYDIDSYMIDDLDEKRFDVDFYNSYMKLIKETLNV